MRTIGRVHGTRAPVGAPRTRPSRCVVAAAAPKVKAPEEVTTSTQPAQTSGQSAGLGDLLGPIGLTYSEGIQTQRVASQEQGNGLGDVLGPIGLTYSEGIKTQRKDGAPGSSEDDEAGSRPASIHSLSTEEWRQRYEKDGSVDLWVEEEFNAGSRLVGGRAVHKGGTYGILTGEGPSVSNAVRHKVRIHNHYADQVVEVEVPEDRYIMWEAEDEGLQLPYACRMGCCTACAVKIVEGEMWQPEALGISQELKDQGYGLMCVGFPMSDLVLQTVPEDEVYDLQFGSAFAQQALNPSDPESIERDDFAISIANMDE